MAPRFCSSWSFPWTCPTFFCNNTMHHYRHWQYIKTDVQYSLSLEGLLQISAFTDCFKVLLNFLDITKKKNYCRRFCYIYSSYSVIFCKQKEKRKSFAVKHTNGRICKSVLSCTGIKHSQSPAFICDSSTPTVETINPVTDYTFHSYCFCNVSFTYIRNTVLIPRSCLLLSKRQMLSAVIQ